MQLNQLAYFLAVVDEGRFTAAADRLGIAQPSLSQQIKALERDLGTSLLNRSRPEISLTAAGQVLLPVARRMVADAETARREIRELSDLGRGRVRLGATPSLVTGLLPEVLALYRADNPAIELVIREGGSRDLQRELSQGAIDLALVIDARLEEGEWVAAVPLLAEELVVISSREHPAPVRGKRMVIEDLAAHPLVMFRPGYDLRERTVAACRSAGFEPVFAIEGGEMDAVLEFVRAGMGIAVVPSTVVLDRFRVTHFRKPGLSRTIQLARRRDLDPPRAAQVLAECLLDYLQRAERQGTLPQGSRLLAPVSLQAR